MKLKIRLSILLACAIVLIGLREQLASIPGATIGERVTHTTETTTRYQKISDCFQTDAMTIIYLKTNKAWMNINGSFIDLPNFDQLHGF